MPAVINFEPSYQLAWPLHEARGAAGLAFDKSYCHETNDKPSSLRRRLGAEAIRVNFFGNRWLPRVLRFNGAHRPIQSQQTKEVGKALWITAVRVCSFIFRSALSWQCHSSFLPFPMMNRRWNP